MFHVSEFHLRRQRGQQGPERRLILGRQAERELVEPLGRLGPALYG
jgi:hypothetical protein